jgi:hypothetical protein
LTGERLIYDRGARRHVARAEVPAVDEKLYPSQQRPIGKRDHFDTRHFPQMFGRLVPEGDGLMPVRDGIDIEKPFSGKADGLIRQAVEGSGEQAGDEQHDKTERDLRCDQGMHPAAV